MEPGERGPNTLALVFGDEAGKHLPEMRVLGARMDVLPAIGFEERGFDGPGFVLVDGAAAPRSNT